MARRFIDRRATRDPAARRGGAAAVAAMTLVLGLGPALACEAGAAAATGDAEECRAARGDWAEAAVAARAPIAGLEECLAAEPGPCGADLAAVRATVAELESHERRIAFVCEGRR